MKVKKINKIESLGPYQDFTWSNQCQELQKHNFFYGWNYSGKTTLSRIFKCLEDKRKHQDFPDLKFDLETDDNDKLTEKHIGQDFSIRVFNEEFVEENFEWNNENKEIEPILILGKESKELEKQLKKKKEDKKKREEEKSNKEKEKASLVKEIDKSLTERARSIRELLYITNDREFDKNSLRNKVNKLRNNYSNYILSGNELNKVKESYNEQSKDKLNSKISIQFNNQGIEEVEKILKRTVSVDKIIDVLKNDAKLSQWVREGLELHKDKNRCEFCGNELTQDRINELQQHFSRKYDNFINKINKKIERIKNFKTQITGITIPDKARLFKEYENKFETKLKEYETQKNNIVKVLEELISKLQAKKEKPFDPCSLEDGLKEKYNEVSKEFTECIKKLNKIIEQHNKKADNLAQSKEKAKKKLIGHYSAEFIKQEKYFDKQQQVVNLNNNIQKISAKINELDTEIENIENQIKANAIGGKKLNEYLSSFFDDNKLKVELTSNGKYKLFRGGEIAKNLSTGERNIISLIYFFAKLDETNFDKQNAIIFIDDPVSSLDSNHIHRVNAILIKKLPEFGQVFVTTHNFDFFNLLKDSCRYDLNNNEGCFYLIKKIRKNNTYQSVIENLPNLLLRFKSEYNYLFYILKSFNDSDDKNNFEQIFLLPNILRRFFEMYLFMRYPDGKRFKDKATEFFKNSNKEKIQTSMKIMDEYSHEENPEHSGRFPDIQEVISVINFILDEINNKDKSHYVALVESMSQN